MLVADRLYLGSDLLFDAHQDGTGLDLFMRAQVGSAYTVLNSLNQGSAVSASTDLSKGLAVSGYAPAATRDMGLSDLLLSVRISATNATQLYVRWVDVNNWIAWYPDAGRVRVRQAGASYDTTVATTSPTSGDLLEIRLKGSDIVLYRNGVVIAAVTDTRFTTATRHGFGHPLTSGTASTWMLRGAPLTAAPATTAAEAAIASASTVAGFTNALQPLLDWAGASLQIHTAAGGVFGSALSITDPGLQASAKAAARVLARMPFRFRSSAAAWTLHLGAGLVSGSSPASGLTSGSDVYVNVPPTSVQYTTVTSDDAAAREHVIHHELGHLIHLFSSAPGASALTSAVTAANTSGFTYGGTATGGPRPTGFCRGYGTQDVREDIADIFGWLMTPGTRSQIDGWCTTDTYLAAKVAAVKTFVQGIGWGASFFG